jgi:hypothetical protein
MLLKEPSVQSDNEWFWVYRYTAVRSLALIEFTSELDVFIEQVIDRSATNAITYAHLLHLLAPRTPSPCPSKAHGREYAPTDSGADRTRC